MNALVRKEIRLILPGWIAAMILAVAPAWFIPLTELGTWRKGDSGYWMLSVWLAFGLLWPALSSFGQEFNLGTFSNLLAQPVERARIWRLKLGVLAMAAASALGAGIISFSCRFGSDPIIWQFVLSSILLIIIALSGGWWTTLLLRQIVPAFLFAVFIPFLITISTVGLLLGNVSDETGMAGLLTLLALYGAAGFMAARRLFWNAQDSQWLGELISLPQLTLWKPARNLSAVKHKAKPLRALIRKEFALQQVTLIVAAAMAVLHIVDLIVRKMCADYLASHADIRGTVEVAPLLWLLLPMVAGSVMVAEERKLGTLESQLCAPISRRWQFALKLGRALWMALLFGAIAPIFLEYLGHLAHIRGGADQLLIQHHSTSIENIFIFGSLAIGLIAFYASTLSRNTLQALGLSVAIMAAFQFFISIAANPPVFAGMPVWGIPLADVIGVSLAVLTVVMLAWSNYGHLHFGARIWRRNALTLLGAWTLTIAASSLIYNRVWEAWMPVEPFHARQSQNKLNAGNAKIISNSGRTLVVTPDNRLWIQWDAVDWTDDYRRHLQRRERHEFVDGAQWMDAAASLYDCYALQSDGSCWEVTGAPKPFLGGVRWRALTTAGSLFAGLRSDGSLWRWGVKYVGTNGILQVPIAAQRIGHDANWVSISGNAAVKSDGSIWRWGWISRPATSNTWTNAWVDSPEPWLRLPGHHPVSFSHDWQFLAAVAEDGSLWIGGELASAPQEMIRVGASVDWKLVCMESQNCFAAIKTNGTLWLLRGNTEAKRISGYPVWVGVSRSGFSLATDGKLCRWDFWPNWSYTYADWPYWSSPEDLMAPSRLQASEVADLSLPSH